MKNCVCLLAALLAVQLAMSIQLVATDPTISSDAITYITMSQEWSVNHQKFLKETRQHPGFQIATAAVHDLLWPDAGFSDQAKWELAGRLISMVCGLLITVGMVIFLHAIFASRWLPWITVFFLIIGRKFASLTAMHLTDMLALCLQVWGLLAAIAGAGLLKRGNRWGILLAAATGAAGGIGYIVRPEAAAVGVIGGALWLGVAVGRRRGIALAVGMTLAGIVAACAFAVPYMVAIGRISPKQHVSMFIPGSKVVERPPEIDGQPDEPPPKTGLSAAVGVVKTIGLKFAAGLHPVPAAAMALWVVLWLISRFKPFRGLRDRIDSPNRTGAGIMLVTAAIILAPVILRYLTTDKISYRYMLLLVCVCCGLGGAGLMVLGRTLKAVLGGLGIPKAARTATVCIVGLILAGGVIVHTLRPLHSHVLYVLEASKYVEARLKPGEEVISNAPHLLYRCGYYQMDSSGEIRRPVELSDDLRMFAHKYVRETLSEEFDRTDRPVRFVALTAQSRFVPASGMPAFLEKRGFRLVKTFEAFDEDSWMSRLYRSVVTSVFESRKQAAQQVLMVYYRPPPPAATTAPAASMPGD